MQDNSITKSHCLSRPTFLYQDGVLSKTEIKEVTASVGTLSIMTFHLQLCSKLSEVVLILDTCYTWNKIIHRQYSQCLNITFHTIKSTTFPFNTSFTENIFVFSVKEYTARQTNHLSWIFCIMSDLWFDGTSNWGEAEERGGRGGHRQQGRPRFSSKSNHNKYLTSLFPRGNFVVKLNFMIL